MSFRSFFKSDLFKFFHTSVWIWHLVIPIAGAGMFLWYYSFSSMQEMDKVSLYIEVLSVTFPFVIGIVTGMVSQMEQNAAGSQLLLTTPTYKFFPHFCKLFVILLMGFSSSFLAFAFFGIGMGALGHTGLLLIFYVKLAVALFLSMIPIYIIQYMVSFVWGNGYSIGLGIVGSLLCALLITSLGDSSWWFLPWGIAARFSMTFFVANISDFPFFQYAYVKQSVTALVLFVMVLVLLSGILLGRWEGRKTEN
ncbi:MAG: lantibiotic immunity ABC transporter MutG family permease subunit [Lachnospiraceae bacterium]|nr:lantibiotic immunity ABC transporter MutG family permease subunit [Lachnospiraceae bacterium]